MAFNRQCNLNGFTPNSTGQIRLGINYWLYWVEIHFIEITLRGRIGYLSEFDQHLSQWIYTQIRPVEFQTGQIGCKFTEITFVCLPVHSMPPWSNSVSSQ